MKNIKLFEEFNNQEDYYYKKAEKLPKEVNVEEVKSFVNGLNAQFKEKPISFSFSVPYPDSSDENGRHEAIPNKWWTGINILKNGGIIGQVKLVKYAGDDWKYFNVKFH